MLAIMTLVVLAAFNGARAQETVPLVMAGETAPDTGGGTFGALYGGSFLPSGDVSFSAWIVGGSSIWGAFKVNSAGEVATILLDGEAAPATGGGAAGWKTRRCRYCLWWRGRVFGGRI